MYQRVGNAAFKKGLGNTTRLLEFLGNPHEEYPKIHIAGTNGKGTVSHMLAAVYQAEGYTVGLYTSPHYMDFRERFKINGQMVSKRYISHFVDRIEPAITRIRPSFFEITVAMAFDAFRKANVDIAIVETGLGGRLDSTNVIEPLVSVITNISFDHMEMLGDTLEAIAGEKAGIIKSGRPVVIGKSNDKTDPVFNDVARKAGSSITYADEIMSCEAQQTGHAQTLCTLTRQSGSKLSLTLPSESPFICENLTTALVALDVLGNIERTPQLASTSVSNGIENFVRLTNYVGRWQVLGQQPLVIADSAHNEAGLGKTIPALLDREYEHLHIVLGVVREKDLRKALLHFPTDATYYFCRPNVPRGLEAETLRHKASEMKLDGKVYTSVRKALAAARSRAGVQDLIFVGGSSFVVAEVL